MGASTAYHLCRRGWTDVVLLERNEFTSGTTWHAAGLVTQARATTGGRAILQRSLEVFRNLEADTGFATGFKQTGTINVATSFDRLLEFKHQASSVRSSGIDAHLLSSSETHALFPLLAREGILGGLYYPEDGRANATDTTISLIRGAQQRGAKAFQHVAVSSTMVSNGRVAGVRTEQGDIEAEYVVNATGMWGRQLAAQVGVEVPLQAMAHYYVITDGMPESGCAPATVRVGDDYFYAKEEAGGLMIGFFEPGSYPWSSSGIPEGPSYIRLPEDWEHLSPFYERAVKRIPVLAELGIKLHFCGPESFTPDGQFHLGEAPRLRNYFIGAGFNSIGLMSGPGAGSVLADLIVDGRTPVDIPETDPARVQSHEVNRRFLEKRAAETLDIYYDTHWPFEQRQSARPLRVSPLHDRVSQAGAVFGELVGWERANWYAPNGIAKKYEYSFGRQNWFEYSADEHLSVREGVALFDQSSFGKILVQGRDATKLLNRLSVANVDREPGTIIYTQWLNQFGGIEADVTVTRINHDRFLVLTGPTTVLHDLAWLETHVGPEEFVTATDVTCGLAMLAIMGPDSRRFLRELTDCDLSNDSFPFGTSKDIDLGYSFVRATRITYVGELGWELLIPTDIAIHIYDVIVGAGSGFGLKHAGYHALNSLRMEKAYRSWGHDISSFDTPLEAGLGWAISWDKPGGFIGLEAISHQREVGIKRRLVQFLLKDPSKILIHDEPIYKEGNHVGRVASSMYGHTLGGSVALGWVTGPSLDIERSWFESGHFEIELAGERIPAEASLRPMYDPKNERPRS